MANVVRILITAKDEVSGTLDKVRDKATLLSKTDIGKGMAMGLGISAFGLATSALNGLTDAMGKAFQGAMQEEAGIKRLAASLRANVAGWDGTTDAIERTAKARMNLGFADDEQRDSLALLVAATNDVTKAQDIQRTAMDLARLKGISLADASQALIKVEAGQYRALKSLGIELRTGATQTEALAAVQKVAAGQAEEFAKTTEGKATVATVKFDEALESLASKALPIVNEGLTHLVGLLDMLAGEGEKPIAVLAQNSTEAAKLGGALGVATAKYRAFAGTTRDANTYVQDFSARAERASDEADDLGYATSGLTDRLDDLSKSLRGVVDDIGKAADAMIEAEYAPEQLGLKFKIATADVKDMKDELRKLKDIKHPTKDQQKDILELELRLSEGREEVKKLRVQMALLNLSTFTTLLANLGRVNKAIPHSNVMIVPAGSHAAGGPIAPYGMSLVGENGPELIRAGSAGAMVTPSVGAVGRQVAPESGSIAFYGGITLNGVGNDVTPKAGSRFAQAVLDEVAEGLRVQRARYAGSAA